MSQTSSEENQLQYRNIFDSASDGLLISDLETGLVVEANPAACKMHAYSREEFIRLQLTDFIDAESQHAFNEQLRHLRSDEVFDIRAQHRCRDGSTFCAEWRGTAITHQGRPCLL